MSVAKAISEVAKAVGAVEKDRSGAGYQYRGIEDMMNALAAPLRNNGVVIVPHVERVEHHDEPQGKKSGWVRVILEVSYRIFGPDGDYIEARVSADALDNSDKAHGKAMSYAYKTLVGQLFCIPTEDDNEQYDSADHDGYRDRDPKVDDILDGARAAFKDLDEESQGFVASEFKSQFGISMKEIETVREAKGLAELIEDEADKLYEVGGSDADTIRELIDGLSKAELAQWAEFCQEKDMIPGEPDSWSDKQVEAALVWLDSGN